MPSLKYRSAPGEPLAPLGFGSHKLGGVRLYFCKHNAFREGMLALPYSSRILFQQPRILSFLQVQMVLHNVKPFVLLQQMAVLFFNSLTVICMVFRSSRNF